MSEKLIITGALAFGVLLCLSIAWLVRRAFVRHDPERAVANVTVAADEAFELQLPGSPGELFFRFDVKIDIGGDYDLLVSGTIFDERGSTRAFAVKTSHQSRIKGANRARHAGTTYASAVRTKSGVTTCTGSVSLAPVHAGDSAVRGVVTEHPSGLLRTGSVYLPRGA